MCYSVFVGTTSCCIGATAVFLRPHKMGPDTVSAEEEPHSKLSQPPRCLPPLVELDLCREQEQGSSSLQLDTLDTGLASAPSL